MEGYVNGKPDVSWWLGQLRAGIKFRKDYALQPQWDTWRKYYRGQWKPGVQPKNIVFSMLRTIVPRIYFRNPSVSVASRKPGVENLVMSQIMERLDNKLIRTMGMKQQMKRISQNTFMFGTGIGKLGFGAEYTPTPDDLGTVAPISSGTGKKFRVEYRNGIEADMPWFLSIHPDSYIIPSGTVEQGAAAWEAHWMQRPLDDVQNDPRLRHTKDLRGYDVKGSEFQGTRIARERQMVDLVEIRDKRTGMVIIIAPYISGAKDLLFQEDALQTAYGVPMYSVSYNMDDEVFWGISDIHILEPYQRELNEIKTQIMKHRRLLTVKILFEKGAITPEQLEKMVDEEVGAGVEINKVDAIQTVTTGEIPLGLFAAEENIMQDVREVLGFSRNSFGEYKPGSKSPTATEAQNVRMASEIRIDERRDVMADMLVDVIRDMHQIIFTRWSDQRVMEINGPAGIPIWIQYKGDMLKNGRFDVSIDPDSSIPETKAVRQDKAERFYTLTKDNPLIDPVRLTSYLLHEMHGVQFDDMLRQIPTGAGTQEQPMALAQYADFMSKVMSGMQKAGANPQDVVRQQLGGGNASV